MGRKPKDDEQSVINQIEALRTKAGLSRQELADKVGVHYQTIGYIERGEYSPSLVLALKIAKALGKKVEQVFEIEGGN
jgi:DNA-binding XRE family transcriptional regulator